MPDPLLLLLVFLAPIPYWIAGLPWLAGTRAVRLAPAFGIALAGWYAELGMVARVGAVPATLAGIVVSAIVLVLRRHRLPALGATLREGALLYLLALVPALVSPFPVLGGWSGDWHYMYEAGQAVRHSAPFTSELLQRPPLAGAIAVPLWLVRDGLPSYQLACAVSSAALLGAILHGVRIFGGAASTARLMLPAAGSMFFLHHTAAAWGKPLAAALVLAAGLLAWQARRDGVGWWRAMLAYALAVAVHQSSILYGGFVVALAVLPWDDAKGALRRLVVAALIGAAVVAPVEIWTISTYGLDVKVAANPSVAQRDANVPFAANVALVALASFIPWNTAIEVARLVNEGRPKLAQNLYWVTTGWLTAMAGTIGGLLLPFAPLLRRPRLPVTALALGLGAAALLAFAGHAVLNPFHSDAGTAQTGLVQMEAGLLVILLLWWDSASNRARRWTILLTLVLATVPFLAVNGGVETLLRTSSSFRAQFDRGSEGDWTERILPAGLEPLGLALFPLGFAVPIAAALALRKRSPRSPEDPCPSSPAS